MNKGKYIRTEEIRRKNSEAMKRVHLTVNQNGSNNPNWKGANAGYGAVHRWVEKQLGTPQICWNCDAEKKSRYYWANIDGIYKRGLEHWMRLCAKCHAKFDGLENNLGKYLGNPNRIRDRFGRFV